MPHAGRPRGDPVCAVFSGELARGLPFLLATS
jgi:hypothetical protein